MLRAPVSTCEHKFKAKYFTIMNNNTSAGDEQMATLIETNLVNAQQTLRLLPANQLSLNYLFQPINYSIYNYHSTKRLINYITFVGDGREILIIS